MSTPIEVNPQAAAAYTTHSGHGSIGPLIAVLAVITILGVIAGMIGRLCSGRTIMGHGMYDFENWVETKCASCIDGRLDPPPRQHTVDIGGEDSLRHSGPVVIPVETQPQVQQERNEDESDHTQARPTRTES